MITNTFINRLFVHARALVHVNKRILVRITVSHGKLSLKANNLNIIMKVLTVITILMTIPNIVFSFYGMNVQDMPLPHTWFPVTLSIAITGLTWLVLKKKNLY